MDYADGYDESDIIHYGDIQPVNSMILSMLNRT